MNRTRTPPEAAPPIRLGLRENLAQFALLVGVNALVGGMIGQERTVLPLLAHDEFGLSKYTATLTFIAAFGIVKAATNFFAGTLSDRYGRKPVLVAGWIVGIPVPLLLMWAPTWAWVVFANMLLGVNQGLTWSTTIIMKIDLVGPAKRGLAMGFNEAAGYVAVAATALATGWIASAHGLRPEPFFLGLAYAALGLGLSTLAVRETHGHARHEATNHTPTATGHHDGLTTGEIFRLTSFRDKALSSCSQAGLVNNLNDGLAWGLFPIFFADAGLSVGRIGILAALYPAAWGLGQLYTGGLSDRVGRKPVLVAGYALYACVYGAFAINTRADWCWLLFGIYGLFPALTEGVEKALVSDLAPRNSRATILGLHGTLQAVGLFPASVIGGILWDSISPEATFWFAGTIGMAAAIGLAFLPATPLGPKTPQPEHG